MRKYVDSQPASENVSALFSKVEKYNKYWRVKNILWKTMYISLSNQLWWLQKDHQVWPVPQKMAKLAKLGHFSPETPLKCR